MEAQQARRKLRHRNYPRHLYVNCNKYVARNAL